MNWFVKRTLKGMVSAAPGFRGFLGMHGVEMDDDCNITNLDSVRARYRRGHGGGGGGMSRSGGGIAGWLAGLIVVLFLAYIAMTLISTFAPVIGNLTYSGGGIGGTIFGIVKDWILPLGLIGLLIVIIGYFLNTRKH